MQDSTRQSLFTVAGAASNTMSMKAAASNFARPQAFQPGMVARAPMQKAQVRTAATTMSASSGYTISSGANMGSASSGFMSGTTPSGISFEILPDNAFSSN